MAAIRIAQINNVSCRCWAALWAEEDSDPAEVVREAAGRVEDEAVRGGGRGGGGGGNFRNFNPGATPRKHLLSGWQQRAELGAVAAVRWWHR